MDGSVPFRAALPLFGIGVLTLLLSCCFCCYLWRLKAQGQREMGYRYVMFKKKKGQLETCICPVCLEEFDDGNKAVITRCSHLFHHKCLSQWLHENNSCPMCKTAVRMDLGENTNLVNGADAV